LQQNKEQRHNVENGRNNTHDGSAKGINSKLQTLSRKAVNSWRRVIQDWATVMSIEQFLKGVEERAIALPERQRGSLLERLQLAREFIGTQDPLEFFNSWKTPEERYIPLAKRNPSI
jgi:hypothetical protein